MRYLLDTDICIYIAKRKPAKVLARLERLQSGDVGMSLISYIELVYGAYKSRRVDKNLASIEQLAQVIPVQMPDGAVARHYGRVRAELERKGSPIGAYDLLIAAHALSLGLILVSNNTREFSRVEGLRVENWAA